LIAAFFTLIALGGIGFATASVLEEKDTFCTSCHMVPETTYYNRAYIALDYPADPIYDLATQHYATANDEPFKCINCHRGDGSLGHRLSTTALAARDSVTYLLGREDPTIEKTHINEAWLPNAACVSCHTATLLTLKGIDNHFHTHLPQAAEALKNGGKLTVVSGYRGNADALLSQGLETVESPLRCSSCHLAHKQIPGSAADFFMDVNIRNQACVECHLYAGKGPQNTQTLGSN
jgi:nitrate/TMAO reductase-like tetraheme cytochrome c subunit